VLFGVVSKLISRHGCGPKWSGARLKYAQPLGAVLLLAFLQKMAAQGDTADAPGTLLPSKTLRVAQSVG